MVDKDFRLPKEFKRMFALMDFTDAQKKAYIEAHDRARLAARAALRRKGETSAADPVAE